LTRLLQVVSEWNPFAGEVRHLDNAVQLQTYRLPWPFSAREYLVRCEDVRHGKAALEAHCRSIDGHPSAPERPDRVRGRSETVWRFTEDNDGHSSIHLETLVDPKGGLPTWVVDTAGKSAAVKIVRALIRYTGAKYKAVQGSGEKSRSRRDKREERGRHPSPEVGDVGTVGEGGCSSGLGSAAGVASSFIGSVMAKVYSASSPIARAWSAFGFHSDAHLYTEPLR
jgi:hypothetical protein